MSADSRLRLTGQQYSSTLAEALTIVRGGRIAVVDVVLPPTSAQVLGPALA